MTPMTVTYPELIVRAVLSDSGLSSFAQVIVVICLAAVLLEREMVRHRHPLWSHAGLPTMTALAVPLVVAWIFIAVDRFIELAGIDLTGL